VSALIEDNPEYADIKLIRADWDTHRRSNFTKELKIKRRSTLVMFKDGKEIARLIAQTNKNMIEGMLKAGLI